MRLADRVEEKEEIREKKFTDDGLLMWVQQVTDKQWSDKSENRPAFHHTGATVRPLSLGNSCAWINDYLFCFAASTVPVSMCRSSPLNFRQGGEGLALA